MKRKATANLARLETVKNCTYSPFSRYAVAGTEMMVTALISVARNERHAAHQGMCRRARKKSDVSFWRRVKAPPMATRAMRETKRTAESGQDRPAVGAEGR